MENTVDSIAIDGKDFGKLTYNVELNHIEANAINALIEALFTVFESIVMRKILLMRKWSLKFKFMG